MIIFKKVTHLDYNDILDIAKDIWDGTDYLPHVFHDWVEDEGYFLGAYDNNNNKLVGCAKLSILYDETGWLEGLRVHKNYRRMGIGRELAIKILEIAKEFLRQGRINRIAFATHATNIESININTKLGFEMKYSNIILSKEENYVPRMNKEDFTVESFYMSYDDFNKLDYTKKRQGFIPLSFKFERVTKDLIDKMNRDKQFISINGYKGMFSIKGDISFECFETSVEALDTFYEYFSLISKEKKLYLPYTSITNEDLHLKDKIIEKKFISWCDWKPDYLYFVFAK
jgi:GNAT superfamily N-acetyltransferase